MYWTPQELYVTTRVWVPSAFVKGGDQFVGITVRYEVAFRTVLITVTTVAVTVGVGPC